ncbi:MULTISPECIES: hypothetical protein [Dictyoglomus]|jgi:hypothetical protein|uniref:hypothetical protein n=1 Tax=Dictyoglomus TaxID=13 RepID=UPI0023535BE2|nr:hypothetical protein [Dictyoglomus turgidum]
MKRYVVLGVMLLLMLNIGLAKQSFVLDFTKNPPKGNLSYEISKGVDLEKEDGEYHLAFLKGGSSLKIYTPVSSLESPKRVILKLTGISSSLLSQETWAPIVILVNSKELVSGFDFGSDYYITPSFNISKYWLNGQTNIVEIRLDKDTSGEFWLKKIEISIYEK